MQIVKQHPAPSGIEKQIELIAFINKSQPVLIISSWYRFLELQIKYAIDVLLSMAINLQVEKDFG